MSSVRARAIHDTFHKRNKKTCSSSIVEPSARISPHFSCVLKNCYNSTMHSARFYFFSTPCSQSLHGVESLCRSPVLKLIPRKKKLSYNFFLTFLTMSVSKNIIKKIGQLVYCRDMMSQIYPVDACTYANHARYVIGSRYILR